MQPHNAGIRMIFVIHIILYQCDQSLCEWICICLFYQNFIFVNSEMVTL